MFTTLGTRQDKTEAKVDQSKRRLSLLQESCSGMRVIMEHVNSRIDQISKAGKVKRLSLVMLSVNCTIIF